MIDAQVAKQRLQQNNQRLAAAFQQGEAIKNLLQQRSNAIDHELITLWQHFIPEKAALTLIAVGGYGRSEMHPQSDIDVLILSKKTLRGTEKNSVSTFIASLWDLGLEVGSSVRTIKECINEAKNDLTIITNLLEMRKICGNEKNHQSLYKEVHSNKLWSAKKFFTAKLEEQAQRYQRFGDTAYRVEPNLKEGPGGLRDLQTILWVCEKHFGIHSLNELKNHALLSEKELNRLTRDRNFLWEIRFALHQLTSRKEDRLLFDYQKDLAQQLGNIDESHNTENKNNHSIIEQFMQRYYKTITELERINELLLALIRKQIFRERIKTRHIDDDFIVENKLIGLKDQSLFKSKPSALMTIFHQLQLNSDVDGIAANTIREIRNNLDAINHDFRNNAENQAIFLNILSHSHSITFVLRRMNRYGVLAAYLPAFGNIVGRMQYDLFHAYTVDEHTLMVIRNIRRYSTEKGKQEHPFCTDLFATLKKPYLLYLAGLFHDIAKGRNGDHSILGEKDAYDFCIQHQINKKDATLVAWLVRNHLLISSIAQKSDINDSQVIQNFAKQLESQTHLDYLFLLTIADISGTNPELMTDWKYTLLLELYKNTSTWFKLRKENTSHTEPLQQQTDIKILRKKLSQQLSMSEDSIQHFWQRFHPRYLRQNHPSLLSWHLQKIIGAQHKIQTKTPIIEIQEDTHRNASAILIYTADVRELFLKIVYALETMQLNIVAANIYSSNDGYALDTIYVLNQSGTASISNEDCRIIKTTLKTAIESPVTSKTNNAFEPEFQIPRRLKHFDIKTNVSIEKLNQTDRYRITVRTLDKPGMLSKISHAFNQHDIRIYDARITTLGEIAEDYFIVSMNEDATNNLHEAQHTLAKNLCDVLDEA